MRLLKDILGALVGLSIAAFVVFIVFSTKDGSTYEDITSTYKLPLALKDCKIFNLKNSHKNLTISRCPNSTTTTDYKEGRNIETSVVTN